MLHNLERGSTPNQDSKNLNMEHGEGLVYSSSSSSMPNSPTLNNIKPTSMVIKKANTVIPAHLVAEAISTLHGLDLRWSGPITPSEMQYVQQYILAKYPEYCNGLVDNDEERLNLCAPCLNDDSSYDNRKSPKNVQDMPSSSCNAADMFKIELEPSKLLDILAKKLSCNFISIPEIQACNVALQGCGLQEEDYFAIFTRSIREAMIMIGEAYPFFKGNYYMTALKEDTDAIREFVSYKESKVVVAPETWLDLRIKGSQLSQYFRRKCKYMPKGLFAYPAYANGDRSSMHWISEARTNSWHVMLDASGLNLGNDRMALAIHRPDFVMCTVDNTRAQPSKIVCFLLRKKSFKNVATST